MSRSVIQSKRKSAHELLDAEAGIEQPAPHRAGNHERHRQRIEEDRAQKALGADALVDQRRQHEAQQRRQADETDAVDHEVDVGDFGVLRAQHAAVAAQPDPVILGQEVGRGEGEPRRPDREADDVGCIHKKRQPDDGQRQVLAG